MDDPSTLGHIEMEDLMPADGHTNEQKKESPAQDATPLMGEAKAGKSSSDDINALPLEGMRDVIWKDHVIKVYPLNYQKIHIVRWQIFAGLLLFLVFGLNDQTTGSLMPTLVEEYNISRVKVSTIFFLQLLGYTLASLCNEWVHRLVGTRGGVIIATSICLIFFSILVSKPSNFYLYLFCYLPLGLAVGILDSLGNVLIGNLVVHKNEFMGLMHAAYGAAAMVTPPLVSHFVGAKHWPLVFFIPLTISAIALIIVIPSFRFETAVKYDYICHEEDEVNEMGETPLEENALDIEKVDEAKFLTMLQKPPVLLYAIFLFLYLGAEISTGSWLFTYLLETKSDNKISMSYIVASYWMGLTVGRLCLGFVSDRYFPNVYRANRVYAYLTVCWYTVFVVVGLFHSNSNFYFAVLFIVIFLCGVFIGPLFPNGSIVALQVLPRRLHISGIGIAVAVGGCGGAALPYSVGVITHIAGVEWIPFLCWAMVVLVTLVWSLYPRYIHGYDEFL
ncbi:Bsc6p NDAI_0G03820 [Naumovozyma dairenensis CBS 421]|uniref:Major facilitator superfamily (MFS) profile domain-containing protein n=1 Tax=Naumovozyma dairenensis (strain ATCC 10597 / BCRC 20456 / CBS 421 / NBRC 0211 / NRRL Y-12639) TaxID=1071378 RepID=G0WEE8_NAUDC|nr:hypothetical protein NDAI_0G03820 [Naumovozyma dairenensis CBS 421]CCD26159.2 hypothetical protein NDAI_0G03820 [Naumovozyma dairenensis CBS 421]